MNIKIGDFVEFKKDMYADEKDTIYFVLEINGDRVILELANTDMAIRPQSIAMLSDLVLFTERELQK